MLRIVATTFLLCVLVLIYNSSYIYSLFSASPTYETIAPLPTTRFTLDNGLDVIVIEHNRLPVVAHMIWYKVGSAQEVAGKTGLAHFLEHMMFQGTEAHPDNQFSSIVAEHGGDQNAFTSFDYTGYYQYITKEYLPVVMELESERMHGLKLSQESFENERKVILEERRMRVDNKPRNVLREKMRASLFPNHPYGNPVIGWADDISSITLEDAKQFYERYYTPKNAVLVIVGDVKPKHIRSLAEQYYGKLPPKSASISRETLGATTYKGPNVIEHSDQHVKTPELIRYYIAPSRHTKHRNYSYALEILAYYLGGSDTSQLYQALVRDKELASHVSVSYSDVALGQSIFSIHVFGKNGTSITELESAVDQELSGILATDIPLTDLQRIQSILYSSTLFSRDSFKYIAQLHGLILASDLTTKYLNQWPNKIIKIRPEQVSEAARFILKPSKLITGVLLTK